jgi:hypothetical protein
MRKLRTALAAALCAVLLASAASPALAGSKNQLENAPPMVDVLFLRPLGFVGTVASFILFVPAAALTAIFEPEDIGKTWQSMVQGPYEYTFVDPLGEH